MIIVACNKEIINFDNVQNISLRNNTLEFGCCNKNGFIATFESAEEAMLKFKEIISAYAAGTKIVTF